MSDPLRKNFTDKISEAVTPDSQKSTAQKAQETVTNAVDSVASKVQPESQKGVAQTAADVGKDTKGNLQDNGESYLDTAKSYVESGKEGVKSAIRSAGEYISGESK